MIANLITISTLGDLVEQGYALRAHCGRRNCGRHVSLDLEHLIGRLGSDHSYLAPDLTPKLRCGVCGLEIGLTLHPNKGYRSAASKGLRGRLKP